MTGATIPFGRKDDGGDLVETSFLCMGLLCARQYFQGDTGRKRALRGRITEIWEGVEWDWYTQGGRKLLYWHWSSDNGWAMDHEIHGWNECLITYVLAASAPRHPIDPEVYHRGYARRARLPQRQVLPWDRTAAGHALWRSTVLRPLFLCGLDPRGLQDRYADYWELNQRHVRINRAHCIANPRGHAGYGANAGGSRQATTRTAIRPMRPTTTTAPFRPTAALASLPYARPRCCPVMRHFLAGLGDRIWGRYGFVEAFCEQRNWYADTYLAIDQGPS